MSTANRLLALVAVVACAAPAVLHAQIPQLIPRSRTLDLLVVDSSYDGVWRKSDINQDGDYNDQGEIISFYSDLIGTVSLTNPSCITVGPDGTAYIGDSTVDIILAMIDMNGDGDANSAGEHRVFFDNTNASGIIMASVQGLTCDAIGRVYAAVVGTSGGGVDMIMRLLDMNQDGDANDSGESMIYCQIPNASAALGDSIPTEVVVGPDAKLYYADVATTGIHARGVYKLDDLNGDGDCNDPGEHALFWSPPAVGNAFYWGLAVDRQGVFYVTDHGNEQVWRAQDLDASGTISSQEETLFYQTGAATYWDVVLRSDGVVYLCDDQTPDRIVALQDQNSDLDALDQGEQWDVYDETVSPTDTRPRGAVFMPAPTLALQPSTVQLGQSVGILTVTPKAFELVGLVISDRVATTPVPLPPFGQIELNSAILEPVVAGTSDSQGLFNVTLTVPNNPSLVGSFAFQAIAGDVFRPFLTNAETLVITP